MRLPDGTTLMHVKAPYDPVKAHEYYLRIRELRGRKKGAETFTVRRANGKQVQLTQQQLVEQQAYAAKRVAEIKQNLLKLVGELRKAMAEAEKKKAKTHRDASKPKTAAEKSKAARESKQYRQKHKSSIATKQKHARKKKSTNADPVAELKAKITQIKGRLIAAVKIQRALASATKNN